ncbi:hypothetical protein ACCO45_001025 [Purpureocillium lilacinum]|uniref:Uncharacterized protein n=1 Tax=Purpureocillium lilacinum TaxID=33203 RepID=A0ACC4E5U2_PURLI
MSSIAAALRCFAVLYNNDTELPTIPADTVRVQSSTVLRRCEHQGRQQRHRPRRLAPLSFGRGKTRRPAPNDNEYEVTNPGSAGLVWRPKEPGRGQGAKSASPSSMFHPVPAALSLIRSARLKRSPCLPEHARTHGVHVWRRRWNMFASRTTGSTAASRPRLYRDGLRLQ